MGPSRGFDPDDLLLRPRGQARTRLDLRSKYDYLHIKYQKNTRAIISSRANGKRGSIMRFPSRLFDKGFATERMPNCLSNPLIVSDFKANMIDTRVRETLILHQTKQSAPSTLIPFTEASIAH